MAAVFYSLDDKGVEEGLVNGKVGIIPTDTVYGIACITKEDSVKKLNNAKKRSNKPGTIIAANIKQLIDLGIKQRYLKAVSAYWPGPVSVVLPLTCDEMSFIHHGLKTIAVRIPKERLLIKLLLKTGPLLTSSANPAGLRTAKNINEAMFYFKDNVDFYVDGGEITSDQPSTIIRIVDDTIEVLRQGAVNIYTNERDSNEI